MTEESVGDRVEGATADLDLLFAQVDELRALATDPEKAQDNDRVYDFSIRWGVFLSGRLQRLDHYYRLGRLAPDERARYETLRAKLRDALPLVEQLGIARPTVALDDTANS